MSKVANLIEKRIGARFFTGRGRGHVIYTTTV